MRSKLRVHLHRGVKVHFHLPQLKALRYHDNTMMPLLRTAWFLDEQAEKHVCTNTHTHTQKIKGSSKELQQEKKKRNNKIFLFHETLLQKT